jgi:hypothetical protein
MKHLDVVCAKTQLTTEDLSDGIVLMSAGPRMERPIMAFEDGAIPNIIAALQTRLAEVEKVEGRDG